MSRPDPRPVVSRRRLAGSWLGRLEPLECCWHMLRPNRSVAGFCIAVIVLAAFLPGICALDGAAVRAALGPPTGRSRRRCRARGHSVRRTAGRARLAPLVARSSRSVPSPDTTRQQIAQTTPAVRHKPRRVDLRARSQVRAGRYPTCRGRRLEGTSMRTGFKDYIRRLARLDRPLRFECATRPCRRHWRARGRHPAS